MSALISMAIYDLEGSGRTELTRRTLQGLLDTVDFHEHQIVLIDNNSCLQTKEVIAKFSGNFSAVGAYPVDHLVTITKNENVGTARAVNEGIKLRSPGQYVIKMDNDVIVNRIDWVEKLEQAMERDKSIGILGLKRKDLAERPDAVNAHFRTKLRFLPPYGEEWIVFEEVQHGVMGTCTMFSPELLDKIGFLYQPTVYGWDDGLICTRSTLAGFVNGFLPTIDIDHIDPGNTFYQKWKEQHAAETTEMVGKIDMEYRTGKRPIYEDA